MATLFDPAGAFRPLYRSGLHELAGSQQARIALCIGVRNVIRTVLTMFKINVPDKMICCRARSRYVSRPYAYVVRAGLF